MHFPDDEYHPHYPSKDHDAFEKFLAHVWRVFDEPLKYGHVRPRTRAFARIEERDARTVDFRTEDR